MAFIFRRFSHFDPVVCPVGVASCYEARAVLGAPRDKTGAIRDDDSNVSTFEWFGCPKTDITRRACLFVSSKFRHVKCAYVIPRIHNFNTTAKRNLLAITSEFQRIQRKSPSVVNGEHGGKRIRAPEGYARRYRCLGPEGINRRDETNDNCHDHKGRPCPT